MELYTPDISFGIYASYPAALDDSNHWWYDATDLDTITKDGSNYVSQWNAKGGAATGKQLAQGNGSYQPQWQSGGTILFDGVDNALKTTALGLVQPEFVYLLMKQVSWTLHDCIWDGTVGGSAYLRQRPTTPDIAIVGGALIINSSATIGQWKIVRALFNDASSFLKIDTNVVNGNMFSSTGMDGISLGSAAGNPTNSPSNVEVHTIVFTNTTDTANETAIYNWLVTRIPT